MFCYYESFNHQQGKLFQPPPDKRYFANDKPEKKENIAHIKNALLLHLGEPITQILETRCLASEIKTKSHRE